MAQVSILLVGAFEDPEFKDAVASLGDGCALMSVRDVDDGIAQCRGTGFEPELILAVQSLPGQILEDSLDTLGQWAPLARKLALLGSWCEGDLRRGGAWMAVPRIYWHQWTARFGRERERIDSARAATWSLPATVTDDERLLFDVAESSWSTEHSPDPSTSRGLIILDSPCREMRQCLEDACRQRGYQTRRWSDASKMSPAGVAGAILDCCEPHDDTGEQIRRFSREVTEAPVVVLISFPRTEDVLRLLECGATAIVSKPFLMDDLFWHFESPETHRIAHASAASG